MESGLLTGLAVGSGARQGTAEAGVPWLWGASTDASALSSPPPCSLLYSPFVVLLK